MRPLKSCITALFILLAATACEKEGDIIMLKGHETSELSASEQEVLLSQETDEDTVLTLSWSSSKLSLSDENMEAPDGLPVITIEIAGTSDFTSVTEIRPDGESHDFSGARLNTVAKDAGLEPGTSSLLYFRIQSSTGANQEPLYSDVASVEVTPYEIDLSKLFLVNVDRDDTLSTIGATETEGEYSGFVQATSWMNFFFVEGDGTVWGNNHVSEVPFELTTEEGMWNCWFPADGGSYYVTMSTNDNEWTATWLPYVAVGGDVTDTLEFYKDEAMWAGAFETGAESAQIILSSEGQLYNPSTGDSNSEAAPLYFEESENGKLTLSETDSNITIPSAGTQTLKLFLTGKAPWDYTITEGNDLPTEEEWGDVIYLSGLNDEWDFETTIPKTDEGVYSGTIEVTTQSSDGFQIFRESGNWSEYWGGTDGNLVFEGDNITEDTQVGTYTLTVDFINETYEMSLN